MRLLCGLLMCFWAGNAAALTVTFDDLSPGNGESVLASSQGFLYDNTTLYLSGQHLYLHDDGGLLSSDIRREDGARFTPHSADVWGISFLNKTGSGPAPTDETELLEWVTAGVATLPTLTFQGIRDGSVVALQSFGPSSLRNVDFLSGFTHLDSLRVLLNIPPALDYILDPIGSNLGPNTHWCREWCASYRVDNLDVTLAPVPLPASLPMLLIGLVGFGLVRRVKR